MYYFFQHNKDKSKEISVNFSWDSGESTTPENLFSIQCTEVAPKHNSLFTVFFLSCKMISVVYLNFPVPLLETLPGLRGHCDKKANMSEITLIS